MVKLRRTICLIYWFSQLLLIQESLAMHKMENFKKEASEAKNECPICLTLFEDLESIEKNEDGMKNQIPDDEPEIKILFHESGNVPHFIGRRCLLALMKETHSKNNILKSNNAGIQCPLDREYVSERNLVVNIQNSIGEYPLDVEQNLQLEEIQRRLSFWSRRRTMVSCYILTGSTIFIPLFQPFGLNCIMSLFNTFLFSKILMRAYAASVPKSASYLIILFVLFVVNLYIMISNPNTILPVTGFDVLYLLLGTFCGMFISVVITSAHFPGRELL